MPNDLKPLPDLPQAITSFGAAVLDEALFIYGGHHGAAHHYSQSGQSGQLWRLDLRRAESWEVVSEGPKLQGLALAPHDGKLYRVGGFTARNQEGEDQDLWSTADFARFDPQANAWEDLPEMPAPRSSFDAAVLGDTLYVFGGWAMRGDDPTVWLDTACAIDLARPVEWRQLAQPPSERRALAVGAIQGKLYVIGGMQSEGQVTRRTAIYDPASDAWSEGPELPGDDMDGFGAACCAYGGSLYVSVASGAVLRLSADGQRWDPVARLAQGRFFHRMAPDGQGRLIVLGGANMERGRFSQVETVCVESLPRSP